MIDTLVLVDGQVVDSIDEKQDAEIQVVLNNKTVKTSQVTDSKPDQIQRIFQLTASVMVFVAEIIQKLFWKVLLIRS